MRYLTVKSRLHKFLKFTVADLSRLIGIDEFEDFINLFLCDFEFNAVDQF